MRKNTEYGASQEFVPIREIRDGIIQTSDGHFVKILEISPVNFSMLSAAERSNIVWSFASFLKISPNNLQLKIVTRKADAGKHVDAVRKEKQGDGQRLKEISIEIADIKDRSNPDDSDAKKAEINTEIEALSKESRILQEEMSTEGYKARQLHSEEYIRLVEQLSKFTAITRRFFLVYRYEGKSVDYADVVSDISRVERQARSYFNACGNEILIHGGMDEENMFAAEVLYLIYNRVKSTETPFAEHVNDVILRRMAALHRPFDPDHIPNIPVVDFIAPNHVSLYNRDYIFIDDVYYSFIMVASDGYLTQVPAGWLEPIIDCGEDIDVDIFAHKEKKEDILGSLRQRMKFNRISLSDKPDTDNDFEDVEDALDAGYYIKRGLTRRNEDFYYINILITITAGNKNQLFRKRENVVDMLRSVDMKQFNCMWRFEQAFISSLPLCSLDKSLYGASKRNVLTYGLASLYPFVSFQICDDNGILLGINKQNRSLCVVDIFNTHVYKNANMCFLGTTGGGKTFTLQMIAMRMRMRGIQCYVIAPDKGHEMRRACNCIGGAYIKISAGSRYRINVMDIRPVNDASDIAIEGQEGAFSDSLLAKKVQDLKIFFTLLIPEMSNVQEQLLDDALIKTYAKKGITHDNDSIYLDDSKTALKEMPILEDLYNELLENKRMSDIATVLNMLVHGSASNFNGRTNVDLENKYIVFDLTELTGKLRPVGMYMVLDLVWSRIKEDRTAKKAVFIDEIWRLVSQNKDAAEWVQELWKTIRGYGGAAVASTQDLVDFFALEDGRYGRAIINNSAINILKYLQPNEAAMVKKVMDLTDSEYKALMRFDRKEGLFCVDSNRVEVEFIPTDFERWLITTDRMELEKLKAAGYREMIHIA